MALHSAWGDLDFGSSKLQSIASSSKAKNSILDELEKTAADLLDDFTQVTKSYHNLSPKELIVKEVPPNKDTVNKLSPKKKKGNSVPCSPEKESQLRSVKSSKSEKKPLKQSEDAHASAQLTATARSSQRKVDNSKRHENGDKKDLPSIKSENCSKSSDKINPHSKNKQKSKNEHSTSSEKNQPREKNHIKNCAPDSQKLLAPSQKTESKQNVPKKEQTNTDSKEILQGKSSSSKGKAKQEKQKKMKHQQAPLVFRLDCNRPATDGILDVSDFKQFLCERFKVNGRVKNLSDAVSIAAVDNCITITSFDYQYSKRYLKYLTKKYLKKRGLRDWLRVVAPAGPEGGASYELRYYALYCQHHDSDEDSD